MYVAVTLPSWPIRSNDLYMIYMIYMIQWSIWSIFDGSATPNSTFFVDTLPDGLPAMDLFGSSMKVNSEIELVSDYISLPRSNSVAEITHLPLDRHTGNVSLPNPVWSIKHVVHCSRGKSWTALLALGETRGCLGTNPPPRVWSHDGVDGRTRSNHHKCFLPTESSTNLEIWIHFIKSLRLLSIQHLLCGYLYGTVVKRGEYPDSTSRGLQKLAEDFGTTCKAIGRSLGKDGSAEDVAQAYEKASVILADYLKGTKLDPMGSDTYM